MGVTRLKNGAGFVDRAGFIMGRSKPRIPEAGTAGFWGGRHLMERFQPYAARPRRETVETQGKKKLRHRFLE